MEHPMKMSDQVDARDLKKAIAGRKGKLRFSQSVEYDFAQAVPDRIAYD